jgi:hypothetical protein
MTWNGIEIKTDNIRPPVPSVQFDWVAWLDGYEESSHYGYGLSKSIAIAELVQELVDFDSTVGRPK